MKLALVLLVGCNSWFSNDPVVRIDAQKFDAPIDAPSQCPPIGHTPSFTSVLHQDILQNCLSYHITTTRATGVCLAPGATYGVFEGAIDQTMGQIAELVPMNSSSIIDVSVLSSDAQTIYLREVDFDTNAQSARAARRQADGTWSFIAPPDFAQNPNDLLAGITAGPTGDHAFVRAADFTIHEWVEDNGVWHDMRVHSFAPGVYDAKLTPDGLRITLYTTDMQYLFSDRADEDSAFRTPDILGAPPSAQAPAITEDCARLYVNGLSSVFYVQQ